jgi:hypothetical protein
LDANGAIGAINEVEKTQMAIGKLKRVLQEADNVEAAQQCMLELYALKESIPMRFGSFLGMISQDKNSISSCRLPIPFSSLMVRWGRECEHLPLSEFMTIYPFCRSSAKRFKSEEKHCNAIYIPWNQ